MVYLITWFPVDGTLTLMPWTLPMGSDTTSRLMKSAKDGDIAVKTLSILWFANEEWQTTSQDSS